jgi:predicted Fe-S protein YdhL (DUF1289 family)
MTSTNECGRDDVPPPSPCIHVCVIDPRERTCRGCLRTLDEIATWGSASPARKRSILAAIERRATRPG